MVTGLIISLTKGLGLFMLFVLLSLLFCFIVPVLLTWLMTISDLVSKQKTKVKEAVRT